MSDLSITVAELEKRLGTALEVEPIRKGFSSDEKYVINTQADTYLLRVSAPASLEQKEAEFALMSQLYASGVRCNRPVDIFADGEGNVCALFSYLIGSDATEALASLPLEAQYEAGYEAGADLRRINRVNRSPADWKQRKWKKHERYLKQYHELPFRMERDRDIIAFIERHYDRTEAEVDCLQHDDFHLGNIIINQRGYVGVLDFNRHDWGDPLHECVKLEWFTWPHSEAFVRGQIAGWWPDLPAKEAALLQSAVYLAMSLFSTIVWTVKQHPNTLPAILTRLRDITTRYDYFQDWRPKWAT